MHMDDSVVALENLPELIASLSENPYIESLHYQHVALSQKAGLAISEVNTAREMLTTYFAASDDIWLPVLSLKVDQWKNAEILPEEVEALFSRAEQDYFSISILVAHIAFLIQGYQGQNVNADQGVDSNTIFSFDSVNAKVKCLATLGGAHTTEGHRVWNLWRDWVTSIVEASEGDERAEMISLLKVEYLKRITTPHSTNNETFQEYSTFVSRYLPASQYEPSLIHASQARQPALVAWRNRERYQTNLNDPQSFQTHLAAEQRKRAKSSDARVRDPASIINIYERAIADIARRKSDALLSGNENDLKAAEAWLALFWTDYISFLQDEVDPNQDAIGDVVTDTLVLARAIRSLPSNSDILVTYIRNLVIDGRLDEVMDVYQRSTQISLSPRGIADVSFTAFASMYRVLRERQDEDGTILSGLTEIVEDAVKRVRDAGGDVRLKLEKLLLNVLLHPSGLPAPLGDDDLQVASNQAALLVWEQTMKHYKKTWHVWTAYTEFLIHTFRDLQKARKAFKDVQSCHLAIDYPESIYEAWIVFEETWGTAKDLEFALKRVRRMISALNNKRSKDAYKSAQVQGQIEAQPAVTIGTTDVSTLEGKQQDSKILEMTTQVRVIEHGAKRKADDEPGPPGKRSKQGSPSPSKRDRENATVFVSGLQSGVSESDLEGLFGDCGAIREIKTSSVGSSTIATVEFTDSASVPMALTKDKKRLRSEEIAVHMAWQSTLYVTNFPERYDDAAIRNLFGKYGTLFDIRWPSKKFKSTRRFCYVQYISTVHMASAKEALVLDKFKLDETHHLSVAVSDPQRRKERTDVNANQREIYVAGLGKFVTKDDLTGVFSMYGVIKEIRMATDNDSQCKGFAFVEFEDQDSAMAALAANNQVLRARHIAVTFADPQVHSKKPPPTSGLSRRADVLNRSLRIHGLPTDVEDGLLQQALEKLSEGVRRVEVFAGTGEATVEFDSSAHAGKLLLMESFDLQGHRIFFSESAAPPKNRSTVKSQPSADLKTFTALSKPGESVIQGAFVPRAALGRPRPKAGLGHTKNLGLGLTANKSMDVKIGDGGAESQGSRPWGGMNQDAFRKMLG